MLLIKSQTQKFIYRLTTGIGPSRQTRAAQHNIIVFTEGDRFAFAINFAAGCEQDSPAEFVSRFKHFFGAADISLYRMNRAVGYQFDPDRRSQMEDYVATPCKCFHQFGIADVALNELTSGMLFETLDIRQPTRAEIIDNDHLIAILKQSLCQMRPDKTCTACYQCFHLLIPAR
jgi:hypothetical protein